MAQTIACSTDTFSYSYIRLMQQMCGAKVGSLVRSRQLDWVSAVSGGMRSAPDFLKSRDAQGWGGWPLDDHNPVAEGVAPQRVKEELLSPH